MIFVVVSFFLIASVLSMMTNPDIFSPAKLFLMLFMAFYVGAVFSGTTLFTESLIMLVLLVGITVVLAEALQVDRLRLSHASSKRDDEPRQLSMGPAALLWLASAPAVFAQLYMIQRFGGLESYVNNIGLRVVEWAGLGWAVVLIELMGPFTVAYFALGLRGRHSRKWWLLYAAHFSIFLIMAFLSGSRGAVLTTLVLLAIVYHYIRGPVKGSQAVLAAVALLAAAMALGALRNTAKVEHGQFTAGRSTGDNLFDLSAFYYGV